MGIEHVTFDFVPGEVFADLESRTVEGVAVPLDKTARKAGRTWRFLKDSVEFGTHTPALHNHDSNRGIGTLASHTWTDTALRAKLSISKTPRGDEMLQLANDGALGISLGIDIPPGGAKMIGDEFVVSRAIAGEISLTPLPAFEASRIDSVRLSADQEKDDPMGDTTSNVTFAVGDGVTPQITVNLDSQEMATAIAAAMKADAPDVTPVAQTQVREPLPYRFDGGRAEHSFIQDAYHGYAQGDYEARNRLDKFLEEVFVSTSDAADLTPKGFRPDLYVDERDVRRPLGSMISGGTLADINTFTVPKFSSAGNLVGEHTEGVEPTLATFVATDQDVIPHALSGKAELNRELVDKAGPQVDGMIWSKMLRAGATAAEARIAEMLDDFVDGAPLALNGVDVALADDLETTFLGVADLDRFSVLAAEPAAFTALATARDDNGRKLFPNVNPSNADGTRSALWTLDLGNGLTAVQVPTLTDSYLIERAAVYQWLSSPRKLNFDIQVKSVFLGFWQYSGEAIIDDAGIRQVTYSA
jgi:hypothetical protein